MIGEGYKEIVELARALISKDVSDLTLSKIEKVLRWSVSNLHPKIKEFLDTLAAEGGKATELSTPREVRASALSKWSNKPNRSARWYFCLEEF